MEYFRFNFKITETWVWNKSVSADLVHRFTIFSNYISSYKRFHKNSRASLSSRGCINLTFSRVSFERSARYVRQGQILFQNKTRNELFEISYRFVIFILLSLFEDTKDDNLFWRNNNFILLLAERQSRYKISHFVTDKRNFFHLSWNWMSFIYMFPLKYFF